MSASAESSLGPIFVGSMLNTLLFGMCLVQYFNYIMSGYDDTIRVRFVSILLLNLKAFDRLSWE